MVLPARIQHDAPHRHLSKTLLPRHPAFPLLNRDLSSDRCRQRLRDVSIGMGGSSAYTRVRLFTILTLNGMVRIHPLARRDLVSAGGSKI